MRTAAAAEDTGIVWAKDKLRDLDFVDDRGILDTNLDGMKRLFTSIKAEVAKVGLCISMRKTKIMETGQNALSTGGCITDGEVYEIIDDLVYLGSTIFINGHLTNVVKARTDKAMGSFSHLSDIWNSKKIHLHTKMTRVVSE